MQPAEVHLAHQMPSYNPFYVDQGYNDVDPIAQFLPNYSIVPGIPHLSQQFMPDTVAYPNDSFNTEAYQQPAASFPPSETTSTQTSLPVSPVSPQDVPQQQQQPQLAIRLSRLTHEPMQTLPLQTAPFKKYFFPTLLVEVPLLMNSKFPIQPSSLPKYRVPTRNVERRGRVSQVLSLRYAS